MFDICLWNDGACHYPNDGVVWLYVNPYVCIGHASPASLARRRPLVRFGSGCVQAPWRRLRNPCANFLGVRRPPRLLACECRCLGVGRPPPFPSWVWSRMVGWRPAIPMRPADTVLPREKGKRFVLYGLDIWQHPASRVNLGLLGPSCFALGALGSGEQIQQLGRRRRRPRRRRRRDRGGSKSRRRPRRTRRRAEDAPQAEVAAEASSEVFETARSTCHLAPWRPPLASPRRFSEAVFSI